MPDVTLGRHRGKFVAVWRDEDGRRQRRSLGTSDRKLAETRRAALKAGLAARAPTGTLTVATIYKAYISDREEDGKATDRIKGVWKRLEPTFGNFLPSHITKKDVTGYIAARKAAMVSDGTSHTELIYLRAALAFAVRMGWLDKAPHIKAPQKPGPREHYLTREDATAMLDAAAMPHVRLFIRLALATAGRAGALLELTWTRVDLDERRIYLRDPDRGTTRKGRATVPINDTLLEALTEARRGALSPFVIEWAGGKVKSVRKGVGAAAGRAGVTCSPHVLRHTAAVWMAQEGISMALIAQYLGHSDSRTTERVYARFSPESMRDASRALNL